jgi:hypothetical protein
MFVSSNIYSNINTILWQKMFGGINYDDPSSIVVHPDSGFAVLSSFQTSPNYSNLWLLRLNNKGDTMWTCQYGDSLKNELPVKLFILPDGYLLLGTIPGSSTDGSIWMIKCDKKGSKSWTKVYKSRIIHSALICKDSSIVMTGQYEKRLFIMKVANNGDSLFMNTFGDTTVTSIGNSIIETNDSGYAISGQRKVSKSKSFAILYRFNTKGDTLWTSSSGNNGGDVANDLFQLSDNSFIIAGSKAPTISENPRPFLQMISPAGKQVWERIMTTDPYAQTIQKLCVLPNKNICAIGTKMKNNGSDVSLQMFSLNGTLLESNDYGNFAGNQSYNYFRDFTVKDETLIITACTQPVNGGQTLVFAVDNHPGQTGTQSNRFTTIALKNSPDAASTSAMYNLLGQKFPSFTSNNRYPGSLRITRLNDSKVSMKLYVK